jgi:hypothetical protein
MDRSAQGRSLVELARAAVFARTWEATMAGATTEDAGREFGILQNLSHIPPVIARKTSVESQSNCRRFFGLS